MLRDFVETAFLAIHTPLVEGYLFLLSVLPA